LELYQKIYVKPSFLTTEHGKLACTACHGGDATDPDWRTAHDNVVRDPTFPDPAAICGDCHKDIVSSAVDSLHYTLAPMRLALDRRSSAAGKRALTTAFDRHCQTCHASCGQCHVSRPAYSGGGFLAGHNFAASPPMDTTCASCHGGRVHGEFTGTEEETEADVHYEDGEMTCRDCHPASEMHAAATGVQSRLDLPQRPTCRSCHEEVLAAGSGIRPHEIHGNRLACQVCHAQQYKNCFNCHAGTDKNGLPFFKSDKSRRMLKIGRNPLPSRKDPAAFVLLRHVPVSPRLFQAYGQDLLDRFSTLPTWKRSAPHSIRRFTAQNRNCNHCHGHAELFLNSKELAPWEKKANAGVAIPEGDIPPPVSDP